VREGLTEYVPHVYRFALRLTQDRHSAEDLTQETFLRAWKGRHQLKNDRAARVWLFRIAANLWKDELRRTDQLAAATLDESEIASTLSSPERELENREDLMRALKLLVSLPPRQQTVLYLTAVEELSLAEVSEILQITTNDAKVHLSLARKRVRELFAKRT
jgi:RNA polymerase sigma-70 factor (ECF subfamily)